MNSYLPALTVFIVQLLLLIAWWRAWRAGDGRDKWLCLFGFLLGQLFILWELYLVNQTGKPTPGSPEQTAFMGRFVLGGFLGGVFTIIGLFYLSFASYGMSKQPEQEVE